jgi:SAM-dependent methyltransferase
MKADVGGRCAERHRTLCDTDATVRSLVACPTCRRELEWGHASASCARCAIVYRVDDGVPVFVPSVTGDAGPAKGHERLYDVLQRVLGWGEAARRLRAALGDTSGRVVLDIGGGTGNLASYLSDDTTYIWLDNDAAKLARLRAKRPGTNAVLGEATRLPFGDKTIDDAVCVSVTHHLPDDALRLLVDEMARVTRHRIVVFDALREARSRRGRFLWRIDRGSFPRTEGELASFLEHSLVRRDASRFAIHHHYLLWVGEPPRELEGKEDVPDSSAMKSRRRLNSPSTS